MKVQNLDVGIHTVELYARALRYEQQQAIIDFLLAHQHFRPIRKTEQLYEDSYGVDRVYRSDIYSEDGIRFYIEQRHPGFSGIRFIVNPLTFQSGKYSALALYQPSVQDLTLNMLKDFLCGKLISLHMPSIFALEEEKLSLSRIDCTINLYFEKGTDLSEVIRLFQHGCLPKHFVRETPKSKKESSHILRLKSTSGDILFTVYDKLYDLKRKNMLEESPNFEVLRLELSLTHSAYQSRLSLKGNKSFSQTVRIAYEQIKPLLRKYLRKIFRRSGDHLPYQKSQKKIAAQVQDIAIQAQMLYLLERISRHEHREDAKHTFRKKYNDNDQQLLRAVYSKFDEIGVNPVTFVKDSKCGTLPSLRFLLDE